MNTSTLTVLVNWVSFLNNKINAAHIMGLSGEKWYNGKANGKHYICYPIHCGQVSAPSPSSKQEDTFKILMLVTHYIWHIKGFSMQKKMS